MRARFPILLAAGLAAGLPAAASAADLGVSFVPGPSCGGLEPANVYVPPQVAYIVACSAALPDVPLVAAASHGFWASLWGNEVATPGPATHEGKLVYLKGYPEGL